MDVLVKHIDDDETIKFMIKISSDKYIPILISEIIKNRQRAEFLIDILIKNSHKFSEIFKYISLSDYKIFLRNNFNAELAEITFYQLEGIQKYNFYIEFLNTFQHAKLEHFDYNFIDDYLEIPNEYSIRILKNIIVNLDDKQILNRFELVSSIISFCKMNPRYYLNLPFRYKDVNVKYANVILSMIKNYCKYNKNPFIKIFIGFAKNIYRLEILNQLWILTNMDLILNIGDLYRLVYRHAPSNYEIINLIRIKKDHKLLIFKSTKAIDREYKLRMLSQFDF